MAKEALSNRQRDLMRKRMPKEARRPKVGEEARVVKAAAAERSAEPRDGLAWLVKKRRLNAAQAREAMLYR